MGGKTRPPYPAEYRARIMELARAGRNPEELRIRYRGHSLDLRLTRDSLTVRGRDGAAPPISLSVNGKISEFIGGTTRVFPLSDEATTGNREGTQQ